jgi:hypothetical protein
MLQTMPSLFAGVHLIELYTKECLGNTTLHAGTFISKSNAEFIKLNAVTIRIKILTFIILVLVNIFMILLCLSYGQTKGTQWQILWLCTVAFKGFFNIILTPFIESCVVGYWVPSLIREDIQQIRHNLLQAGARLVNNKKPYHLHQFSAGDYISSAVLLAKRFPQLIEAKLILMIRNPYPEPIVQRRMYRQEQPLNIGTRGFWQHTMIMTFTSMLLYIGSLPGSIQRLVSYVSHHNTTQYNMLFFYLCFC